MYSFTFCTNCMSKLFHYNSLLESWKWSGFLKILYGKLNFGPGVSNFFFQFVLNSTLEFLESVYFSRVGRFVILSLKMSFMKLWLISLRVLKISVHKLQYLETFTVLFWLFQFLILRMNYCSHYIKNGALVFANFQLHLKT